MLKEFKKFALRGNMIDLAVGIIIGGAFTGIVNSLVNDLIMPILSLFTKNIDFTNLFISLDGKHYETLAAAKAAEAATLNYGSFLSGVLNFLIMAFVVFLLVRWLNKLKKPEPVAAPTTKPCPYCYSDINLNATKCPHCTSEVGDKLD
ncbi:MAG: large conductance mechanosensitive channel protein MscL [Mobilitalea sp.]